MGRRIVLGVGGGIAAYKACLLLRLFKEAGHDVRVVPTQAALNFVGAPTWAALSGHPVSTSVWDDVDEVPHVRIGQQADLVVVVPATADLLARAAHGLADDLLTNVLLTARCPVMLAPAMHTEMWTHPATVANVATLRERGVHVVDPASGRLTGADTGPGRLPEPEQLFTAAVALLPAASAQPVAVRHPEARPGDRPAHGVPGAGSSSSSVLAGRRVVISAGGTREPLDPVRFLGNRSSGRQGVALARAALDRGAKVTLVSGSIEVAPPPEADLVRVETALQMRDAMTEAVRDADVVVMAAAVADFRPSEVARHKIKKTVDDEDAPVVTLVRNPDILAGLVAARRPGQVVVGFAAETGDDTGTALEHATAKLARKGCDLLVLNDVSAGKVFGKDDTEVVVLAADGTVTPVPPGSKERVAEAIWDAVLPLVNQDG
ncbi:bifunctional phosphopantothenoylcysteine decarboxylase/phosphopantothenate synthase [Kineosporia sp. J2-2]|uniref:Coenzyme A biosynthesis bifunctional protein CoaBC n=1 Tax=Kineosporia corallincola TaxID=2835133 RepID=A0ABS5TDK5_9ACTN|nr:bifunctional phosphopantothenoylcysteine decarboxylase/phosphopantothenate synthase [Kineosporia corallincola]MBT0768923.1 bifunctional phosphopantothenoylcysteine decarboxylase/phosphopantothenate synthase [Kineosporia corallincola]